jgi:hypothetical protein
MLETLFVFAVLLILAEGVVRYRRVRKFLRSAEVLNELGRRRLP